MLNERIIVLIGLTHQQIAYHRRNLFTAQEEYTLRIVEVTKPHQLFGYRDGWYLFVGEWAKIQNIHEIYRMLDCGKFKELELVFEEPYVV